MELLYRRPYYVTETARFFIVHFYTLQ